jgi:hypothetical protein
MGSMRKQFYNFNAERYLKVVLFNIGMITQTADADATTQMFIEAFEKGERDTLIKKFLEGFLLMYAASKREFNAKRSKGEVLAHLNLAKTNIENGLPLLDPNYNPNDQNTLERSGHGAMNVGGGLGTFLGTVRFGIAGAPNYNYDNSQEDLAVLECVKNIAYSLKSFHKKIKKDFLVRQMSRFGKQYPNIPLEKKKFLASIAAAFA